MKFSLLNKIILTILLFSVVTLISSCALIHPVADQQTLYTLDPSISAVSSIKQKPSNLTLLVLQVQPNPELAKDNMAYVTAKHQIAYYAKNRWVAEPASMLLPLIVQAIRNKGKFIVVQAPFMGLVDLRLNTQLLAFQQEFLSHPSQFRVVIAAQLTEAITNRVIATTQLQQIAIAPEDSPFGGAIAANQAVQVILNRLADFVVTATSAHRSIGY